MKLIVSTPCAGKTTFVKSLNTHDTHVRGVDFDYKCFPNAAKVNGISLEVKAIHSMLINAWARAGCEVLTTFNGWFAPELLDVNAVDLHYVAPIWDPSEVSPNLWLAQRAAQRGDSEEFVSRIRNEAREWCADIYSAYLHASGVHGLNVYMHYISRDEYISDVITINDTTEE